MCYLHYNNRFSEDGCRKIAKPKENNLLVRSTISNKAALGGCSENTRKKVTYV